MFNFNQYTLSTKFLIIGKYMISCVSITMIMTINIPPYCNYTFYSHFAHFTFRKTQNEIKIFNYQLQDNKSNLKYKKTNY